MSQGVATGTARSGQTITVSYQRSAPSAPTQGGHGGSGSSTSISPTTSTPTSQPSYYYNPITKTYSTQAISGQKAVTLSQAQTAMKSGNANGSTGTTETSTKFGYAPRTSGSSTSVSSVSPFNAAGKAAGYGQTQAYGAAGKTFTSQAAQTSQQDQGTSIARKTSGVSKPALSVRGTTIYSGGSNVQATTQIGSGTFTTNVPFFGSTANKLSSKDMGIKTSYDKSKDVGSGLVVMSKETAYKYNFQKQMREMPTNIVTAKISTEQAKQQANLEAEQKSMYEQLSAGTLKVPTSNIAPTAISLNLGEGKQGYITSSGLVTIKENGITTQYYTDTKTAQDVISKGSYAIEGEKYISNVIGEKITQANIGLKDYTSKEIAKFDTFRSEASTAFLAISDYKSRPSVLVNIKDQLGMTNVKEMQIKQVGVNAPQTFDKYGIDTRVGVSGILSSIGTTISKATPIRIISGYENMPNKINPKNEPSYLFGYKIINKASTQPMWDIQNFKSVSTQQGLPTAILTASFIGQGRKERYMSTLGVEALAGAVYAVKKGAPAVVASVASALAGTNIVKSFYTTETTKEQQEMYFKTSLMHPSGTTMDLVSYYVNLNRKPSDFGMTKEQIEVSKNIPYALAFAEKQTKERTQNQGILGGFFNWEPAQLVGGALSDNPIGRKAYEMFGAKTRSQRYETTGENVLKSIGVSGKNLTVGTSILMQERKASLVSSTIGQIGSELGGEATGQGIVTGYLSSKGAIALKGAGFGGTFKVVAPAVYVGAYSEVIGGDVAQYVSKSGQQPTITAGGELEKLGWSAPLAAVLGGSIAGAYAAGAEKAGKFGLRTVRTIDPLESFGDYGVSWFKQITGSPEAYTTISKGQKYLYAAKSGGKIPLTVPVLNINPSNTMAYGYTINSANTVYNSNINPNLILSPNPSTNPNLVSIFNPNPNPNANPNVNPLSVLNPNPNPNPNAINIFNPNPNPNPNENPNPTPIPITNPATFELPPMIFPPLLPGGGGSVGGFRGYGRLKRSSQYMPSLLGALSRKKGKRSKTAATDIYTGLEIRY